MPGRTLRICFSLILLVLLLLAQPTWAAGILAPRALPLAPRAAVNIAVRSPSGFWKAQGSVFELEIRVEGTEDVAGADAYLHFDPTYLVVVDSAGSPTTDPARGLTNGSLPLVTANTINNGAGLVQYSAGTTGAAVRAPFTLFRARFKALAQTGGSGTSVWLDHTQAIDANSGAIPANPVNGTLYITAPPTVTPTGTATHTPTITPTASNTPTATATPTAMPGELCVLAFNDRNGNLQRDGGEGLLAQAGITVRDGAMGLLHQYTTDGQHEPKCWPLRPGSYYVQESDPPGHSSSGPNWYGISLPTLGSFTVAFADRIGGADTPTPTRGAQSALYLPLLVKQR